MRVGRLLTVLFDHIRHAAVLLTGATRFGACFLLAALCSGCASPGDQWFGKDKAAHLAVSTAISAAATRAAIDSGESAPRAHAQAVGVVLVVGLGKEGYDREVRGTGWSWRDMVWNLLGGVLGGALVRATD